jgi:hypothetical protein
MSVTTAATVDAVEVPAKKVGFVKVAGLLGVAGGIALIVVGLIVWIMVSSQLRAENITVPDDAIAFQGQTVAGPFTAFVQADIIQHHALTASDGQTYAELAQDDPVRATMMNASFLRASLFTSVVSFGVAAFAMGLGVLSILFGAAIHRLASVPVVVRRSGVAAS